MRWVFGARGTLAGIRWLLGTALWVGMGTSWAALALEATPCDAPATCLRAAAIALQTGRLDAAQQLLKPLLQEETPNPYARWARFLQGRVLLESGEPGAGIWLATALKGEDRIPDHLTWWLCRARRQEEGPLPAGRCFLELARQYPESPLRHPALWEAAWAFLDGGAWEQTRLLLAQLVIQDPDASEIPKAWWTLGWLAQQRGDEEEALRWYLRLWRDRPETPQARRVEEVFKAWDPPVVPPPSDWFQRGKHLDRAGRPREAVRAFQVAQKDPRFREEALFRSGQAYFRARQWDRAIQTLERYLEDYPQGRWQAEALFWKGKARWRRGDHQGFLQDYQTYLNRFPRGRRVPEVYLGMALFHREQGRTLQALQALERLWQLRGTSRWGGEARWWQAWWAYLDGDLEQAYQRVASLAHHPDRTLQLRARYWMARWEARKGQWDLARQRIYALCEEARLSYYCLMGRLRLLGAPALPLLPVQVQGDPTPSPPLPERRVARIRILQTLGLSEGAALEARFLQEEVPLPEALPALVPFLEQWAPDQALRLVIRYQCKALESGRLPRVFLQAAYPRAYGPFLLPLAREQGVDPFLVLAVIREESGFNPRVVSRAGAVGLMQLLPSTARLLNGSRPLDPQTLQDPEENLRLGIRYLAGLLQRFQGRWVPALAAYNAGPTVVSRWLAQWGGLEPDAFVETIPYRETRRYVKRVLRSYWIYQGLDPLTPLSGTQYSLVQPQ